MNINHPTPEQIPSLRTLWKEAFGDFDPFLDAFFATAFDEKRCLAVNGADAACYWLDCACAGQKIAYLYAVATAKHRQGQGFCRALMEQAKQVQCEAAILESHRNWIDKDPVKSLQLSAKYLNERV